jgi:hypothetical protein
LERDRAKDKSEYKKSGFKVNPVKAYSYSFPFVFGDLQPMPILFRYDYIYYILLNHKEKAYEIYPEEHHALLDDFNLRLTYHIERLKGTDAFNDFRYRLNEYSNKNNITSSKHRRNRVNLTEDQNTVETNQLPSKDKEQAYKNFLEQLVINKKTTQDNNVTDEDLTPEQKRLNQYKSFLNEIREKTNSILKH